MCSIAKMQEHCARCNERGAHMLIKVDVQVLHEETKGDAIITTGVGQHQMWAAQYYKFDRPRQWATSGGLGSMGFGLPSALGAAMAFDGTDGGRPKKVRVRRSACLWQHPSLVVSLKCSKIPLLEACLATSCLTLTGSADVQVVVDIDGDGSFLMNCQELATAAIEKMDIKMFILNNQHLGMVVQWEDRFYKVCPHALHSAS